MNTGIYKLSFTDGSYYIGQSCNLKKRKLDHYRYLLKGNHHSYKVQDKYDCLGKLPMFEVVLYDTIDKLNEKESLLINLQDIYCLNMKNGGGNNFGENTPTSKYMTVDIEVAFLLLVSNPGIRHKEVADFTGVDIDTVHDISAGRGRALSEMSLMYPEKYAKLLSIKAPNTRGKTTIVLEHEDGRKVTLKSGEYSEFCRNNGVQSSNLAKVVTGKRKSTMQWKLLDKYENI